MFLKDGTTQAANPSSTSSSPSQIPSISPTSSGVSTGSMTNGVSSGTSASSAPNSQVNAGAIAGIAIGGLAGIVLLAVSFWFLLFRRRRVKKTAENAVGLPEGYPPTSQAWSWPYKNNTRTEPQEAQGSYAEDYNKSELKAAPVSWTAGRSELDGGQRSELGGGQRSELDGGQTNPPAKFPK